MAAETALLSQWCHMLEGVKAGPNSFYNSIEAVVKSKQIPDVKFKREEWKEGGFFSGTREYLKINRGDLTYLVCGAPFANGFFVSARLIEEGSAVDRFLGGSGLKGLVKPETFYKADVAAMYRELVHAAVMETVDSLMSAAGIPALSQAARAPVLREFYQ